LQVSALQIKSTELMEMISSREKRETSVLDKLKQAEVDIATRTKDLRRLARALKLQDEKVTKLQEEKESCLREKDEAVSELNSELEVTFSSFFFFFLYLFVYVLAEVAQ
jgi:uncharacterized membrane protein